MPKINVVVHPTLFRNTHHKASANIAYTASWILSRQKAFIHHYGLTWTEFNVLSVLRERFPYALTGKKIKNRLPHIAFGALNTVRKLIDMGFAEDNPRAKNRDDRGFSINRNGLNLLTRIDKKISEMDKITAAISPGEAEELSLLLDKIRG